MTYESGLVTTRSLALSNFFTLKGLSLQMGGCEERNMPRLCLKELIDNALDASGKTPEIKITNRDGITLTVKDKGSGIDKDTLEKLLNYNISVSSKFHYIRETRGALGNALHCVFAAPYVLAQQKNIELKKPWIEIRSKGRKYFIGYEIDWEKQAAKPQVKEEKTNENEGTEISIAFPEKLATTNWIPHLLKEFSAFNPNAHIAYSTNGNSYLVCDGEANIKLLGKSSIYYYTGKDFEDLLVAKARDDMLLRDFISKFKLTSSSYGYVKKIIEAVWSEDQPTYLKEFSHDVKKIRELQEGMRRCSPKPKEKDLGRIGRTNIRSFIDNFYYLNEDCFWYVAKEDVLTDEYRKIPYCIEVALAFLEKGKGDIYVHACMQGDC